MKHDAHAAIKAMCIRLFFWHRITWQTGSNNTRMLRMLVAFDFCRPLIR
jgi:hypothetical protein